jgi:hypothetical protein
MRYFITGVLPDIARMIKSRQMKEARVEMMRNT